MNLGQIIAEFRAEAGDTTRPYFWTDERATVFANEAQDEACRRSLLLVDSSSSFCVLSATAGEAVVKIDPRILDIRRARIAKKQLAIVTCADMDSRTESWEEDEGEPESLVMDYQSGAVRFWPIPTSDVDVSLTVARLPLSEMANESDTPEIRNEHQRGLINWMLHRAYLTQDADALDSNKAAQSLALFEREFGRRSSARNEQWRREQQTIGAEPIA